jgi:hypothetical protein
MLTNTTFSKSPCSADLSDDAIPVELRSNIERSALEEFSDSLLAIVLGGSRVRGTWHESSDLDVHIIHTGTWYQKRIIGPSRSLFEISLDATIVPLRALHSWVSSNRAYSDFYTNCALLYPRRAPEELDFVFKVARRSMALSPSSNIDTEEHHFRYIHIRRVLDYAIDSSELELRSSLAYGLSALASFRLFLEGSHHVRHHALASSVRNIDPVFADRYEECLTSTSSREALALARALLERLRPSVDFIVGSKQ